MRLSGVGSGRSSDGLQGTPRARQTSWPEVDTAHSRDGDSGATPSASWRLAGPRGLPKQRRSPQPLPGMRQHRLEPARPASGSLNSQQGALRGGGDPRGRRWGLRGWPGGWGGVKARGPFSHSQAQISRSSGSFISSLVCCASVSFGVSLQNSLCWEGGF